MSKTDPSSASFCFPQEEITSKRNYDGTPTSNLQIGKCIIEKGNLKKKEIVSISGVLFFVRYLNSIH